MPPVIAIVGRPNVGKSTLFNRLTGGRTALVSDLPGLTRDRKEGEGVVAGNPVTIVDTAGLEESGRGTIAARMRAQSEAAIASADLILFVVDARAGITPADKSFARVARVSGKPVLLLANKCEGRAAGERAVEGFELGLGEPIPISAEHGEGLADLEDAIARRLELEPKRLPSRRRRRKEALTEEPPTELADAAPDDQAEASEGRAIRIAIVGRPNAGKSTLVNAILGEERMITGPEPGLTRDSVATDLQWKGRAIRLFDTAGLRKKARISETAEKLAASDAVRAIRFAEVVVLLTDASQALEQQDLIIANMVLQEGRALVVAVNKWDAVEEKQRVLRDIHETAKRTLADAVGVTVLPVSALSGRGIDKLMDAVIAA
jgi:GTP-binding protein